MILPFNPVAFLIREASRNAVIVCVGAPEEFDRVEIENVDAWLL